MGVDYAIASLVNGFNCSLLIIPNHNILSLRTGSLYGFIFFFLFMRLIWMRLVSFLSIFIMINFISGSLMFIYIKMQKKSYEINTLKS